MDEHNYSRKLHIYTSPLQLAKEFINKSELRIKYFDAYQICYSRDDSISPKLIIINSLDTYRDVTQTDLMDLQLALMLNENIDVKSFSILTQALINTIYHHNKINNIEKIYDETQDIEKEMLVNIIYKLHAQHTYVKTKDVLAEFGLSPQQYKRYDQKLAKIFKEENFVKKIKKTNNIRTTVYYRDDSTTGQ